MDSGDSRSSSGSLSSLNDSTGEAVDDATFSDCEGTQPYLFEPYDSAASSGTDSTSESEEEQLGRLQNTDW